MQVADAVTMYQAEYHGVHVLLGLGIKPVQTLCNSSVYNISGNSRVPGEHLSRDIQLASVLTLTMHIIVIYV
jgi:hypothetical protein